MDGQSVYGRPHPSLFRAVDPRAIADALGYPAAALGILVESAGIPFPGEIMLLAVAAYAAQGHLRLPFVIAFAAAGSILGGNLGYAAGRYGGRPFLERFLHLLRIGPAHIAATEMFFVSHGDKAVFLGRFVVGARTWGSMLAGMARMPFWRFQVWSALGGVAWATVIGVTGYVLGNNWALLTRVAGLLGYGGAAVLLIAAGVIYLALRARSRRSS